MPKISGGRLFGRLVLLSAPKDAVFFSVWACFRPKEVEGSRVVVFRLVVIRVAL